MTSVVVSGSSRGRGAQPAMHKTAVEILAQPRQWREVLALARARAAAMRPLLERPVAIVGAGSSYYVGLAAAAYLEERLAIPARAAPASVYRPRPGEGALFISRSGTTTEVLEAARAARAAGVPTLSVTCEPDSPLAQMCDAAVVLGFIREESVVQTGSATGAFLLLRAVAHELSGGAPLESLATELEQTLARPVEPDEPFAHLVVLGSGWRYGLACEAALKAQEMALLWTERYVPLEYRHGPISCADAETLVFVLDPPDEAVQRLAADVEQTGARVVVGERDPIVELVRLQRLALAMSLRRGLDPDRPRHLVRSVVL